VRGSSFDQVYQGEARTTDKTSAKMKSPLTVSRTKWWKKQGQSRPTTQKIW